MECNPLRTLRNPCVPCGEKKYSKARKDGAKFASSFNESRIEYFYGLVLVKTI